ncbi:MAG: glycosyltransferase family 9 protein [Fimbriimonadaceae bacterium]|nr:glycosyltransferase family 9 protein [Fimbriimonadaceae bacterium]
MRVLLFSAKWLGDAVNTTGAVAAVQDAWPNAEIVVSVGEPGAGVFEGWPGIETWVRPRAFGIAARLRLANAVRRRRFDLAVHLEASRTIVRLARVAGVPRRVGVVKPGDERLLERAIAPRPDRHEIRGPLPEVLAALGIPGPAIPTLRLTQDERSQGEREFAALGSNRVVGLHLGASNERKQWPLTEAAGLIDALSDRGVRTVLFGGPADAHRLPKTRVPSAVLAGRLTVREMAAVMAHLSAFVSGDSGPMHVAGTMGVPLVALFGPTNPRRYAPPGDRHVLLRRCDCPLADADSNDACDGHCTRAHRWSEVLSALDSLIEV